MMHQMKFTNIKRAHSREEETYVASLIGDANDPTWHFQEQNDKQTRKSRQASKLPAHTNTTHLTAKGARATILVRRSCGE